MRYGINNNPYLTTNAAQGKNSNMTITKVATKRLIDCTNIA